MPSMALDFVPNLIVHPAVILPSRSGRVANGNSSIGPIEFSAITTSGAGMRYGMVTISSVLSIGQVPVMPRAALTWRGVVST